MVEDDPNSPDSPNRKRNVFLLTLYSGGWEQSMPFKEETSLENVQGLEELHGQLQKIGDYTAAFAYPLAREANKDYLAELMRTLEIRFKNSLTYLELLRQLPPAGLIERMEFPVSRMPLETSPRVSVIS